MELQPPAAALMEELIEEVFLRVSPEDPKSLFCAALACKRWCDVISGASFRRRFCELHPSPPMLGVVCNLYEIDDDDEDDDDDDEEEEEEEEDDDDDAACLATGFVRFVSTSSFCPPQADHRGLRALDSRHGRVLLHTIPWGVAPLENVLVVWDPIAGVQLELPKLPRHPEPYDESWNAAVLCAAGGGCNHIDCRRGPFLVVFVGAGSSGTFTRVYSSNAGTWSEPAFAPPAQQINCCSELVPSALVGDALYFVFTMCRVLKYDLTTRAMSVIHLPPTFNPQHMVLTGTEEGVLGLAWADKSRLHLWSRVAGTDNDAEWAQSRVIELKTLLPVSALSSSLCVIGAHGVGAIFVRTYDGLFSIDLKSSRARKVCDNDGFSDCVVPYMSFCIPAPWSNKSTTTQEGKVRECQMLELNSAST